MTIPVEEAIARIPMWKDAADLRVSLLHGGITNHNYRVDVGGESYVLRVSGDKTELLGINREHEYRTQRIAAEIGIAPEVVYFLEPEGFLVTRFIRGRPIPPEELRQPENLQRLAKILRRIHSMPEIPGVFNSFQVVRDYADIARKYNVPFPKNFDWLLQQMNAAESALNSQPRALQPCHNDLLNGNFLLTEWLYILDWEYAGMGDIFFDLANFSNNQELSEEEDDWLLGFYLEKVTPQHLAHLKIMKVMSDFREAMWGLVQLGISNIDFDFREYANKHFDRLTQNIQNPDWNQWLEDIRDISG
jgi:thiamine kinase-like enzyme